MTTKTTASRSKAMARATKRGCNIYDTMRIGQSSADIQKAILNHLHYTQAKPLPFATGNDWYMAVAHAVRDQMVNNWLTSFYDMYRRRSSHFNPRVSAI
jgi:starch phosphorylase